MDAPTRSRQGLAFALRAIAADGGGHHDTASGMTNLYVADGDVGDFTARTYMAAVGRPLILGAEKNGIPSLRETAPGVLHQIPIDQNANRIFELKVILHDKGVAVRPADEGRVARHPLPGLPKVIAQDFDVGRGRLRRAAAKQNAFARRFDEIVLNLERAILVVTHSARDRVRVGAIPGGRNAMEFGQIASPF